MMRAYAETDGVPARLRPQLLRRGVRPAVRQLRRLRLAGVEPREPGAEPFPLEAGSSTRSGARAPSRGYEDDKLVVLFDEAGYKTLSIDLILERDLLRPA